MKYIQHHKFVPVKKCERMKKDTNSNTEWFNGGRPAKIDPEKVTNSILNMKDGPTNGNTMTSSQLHEFITKFHVKNCVERLNMKECDVKTLSSTNTLHWVANKVRANDKFSIFFKRREQERN